MGTVELGPKLREREVKILDKEAQDLVEVRVLPNFIVSKVGEKRWIAYDPICDKEVPQVSDYVEAEVPSDVVLASIAFQAFEHLNWALGGLWFFHHGLRLLLIDAGRYLLLSFPPKPGYICGSQFGDVLIFSFFAL